MQRFLLTILSALAQSCTHTRCTKEEGRQSGLGLASPPCAQEVYCFRTLRGETPRSLHASTDLQAWSPEARGKRQTEIRRLANPANDGKTHAPRHRQRVQVRALLNIPMGVQEASDGGMNHHLWAGC